MKLIQNKDAGVKVVQSRTVLEDTSNEKLISGRRTYHVRIPNEVGSENLSDLHLPQFVRKRLTNLSITHKLDTQHEA